MPKYFYPILPQLYIRFRFRLIEKLVFICRETFLIKFPCLFINQEIQNV